MWIYLSKGNIPGIITIPSFFFIDLLLAIYVWIDDSHIKTMDRIKVGWLLTLAFSEWAKHSKRINGVSFEMKQIRGLAFCVHRNEISFQYEFIGSGRFYKKGIPFTLTIKSNSNAISSIRIKQYAYKKNFGQIYFQNVRHHFSHPYKL